MRRKVLVITGLRRSGTTALWQCFRGIENTAAFDEPFHPALATGPRENPKGTWTELSEFLDAGGIDPVAIAPEAEVHSRPSEGEKVYFGELSRAAEQIVFDTVRAWNRIPDLYPDPQQTLTIHLLRDPCGWITGHLLPTGKKTWRKSISDPYRWFTYFSRTDFYNNYHYEAIIDKALAIDAPLWKAVAMSTRELSRAPAYIKLLAFWWCTNLATYQALKEQEVPRIMITLQEFSAAPDQQIQRLLNAAGWEDVMPDLSHVKSVRASHGSTHPAWKSAARNLGVPSELLVSGGATSAALEVAFHAATQEGRRAR